MSKTDRYEVMSRGSDELRPKECGGCRACCTVMKIDELVPPKPTWTPCAHECMAGCTLHATAAKPTECVGYECLWLAGYLLDGGPLARRPDRLGLIFDFQKGHQLFGGLSICAHEVWPDARKSERAQRILRALGKRIPVTVRKHGCREPHNAANFDVFGPAWWVGAFSEFKLQDPSSGGLIIIPQEVITAC